MIKIYKHFVPVRSVLFIAVDVTILFVAMNVMTRYVFQGASRDLDLYFFNTTTLSLILVATTALSGLAAGLYREDAGRTGTWLVTAATAVGLALTLGSITVLAFRFFHASSPISLAHWEIGFPLIWPVCFLAMRRAESVAVRRGLFKRRILLIGDGPNAAEIEAFARRSGGHHEIARRLDPGLFEHANGELAAELAPERLKAERIREVVIAPDDQRRVPMELLLEWKLSGITVRDCLSFWEREAGHIALAAFDPAWFVYGAGCRRSRVSRLLKRGIDIVAACLLLALTAPLLGVFALAIRLETRGPVFYRQQRTGRHGKPFALLKFRSMRADAEAAVPQWATSGDPRVTRVGRLMRSTRFDELPQLLMVIRGDMSLIGPRPERPYFVELLSKELPHYADRHHIRPGLTGWAQINYPYGASTEDARRKLAYDLYYLKNQSTLLDLYILIATIRVILLREGAR